MFPDEYLENWNPKDHPSVDQLKILWHSVAPHIRCYSEDTETLTDKGWKLIRDVTPQDRVLTLDPKTFEIKFQKPIAKYSYYYSGPMYRIRNKQVDLLVTPLHRVFIGKKNRAGEMIWRFDLIDRQSRANFHMPKTGIWKGEEPQFFQIGERRIPIEDFVRFMGYYLSEGYIDHNPVKSNYTVALCQRKENLEKFRTALERVSPNKVYIIDDRKVVVRDKILWSYLRQFGYAHEKFIPDEIKRLSPRLLRIFLEAYLEGDGTESPRAVFTCSPRMRDDLQEVIIKAGFSSNWSVSRKAGKQGTFGPSKYDLYRISINSSKTTGEIKMSRNQMVQYSGGVYCLEVPTHVFLVRRKGKAVFCGNSGYGTVTRHVCGRLVELGYDLVVSAYYGIEPGGVIQINGIPCVPCARHLGRFGEGSYKYHYKAFRRNVGILHCYDEKTEILTKNGWKAGIDLTSSDEVLVLDPRTLKIFYEKPRVVHKYFYSGPMISFKSKAIDLLVTPDHKMLLKTRSGRLTFRRAKDLLGHGRLRFICHGKWISKKHLDPRRLQIIAWYITEGYLGKPYSIHIYQSEKSPWKKEIIELIQSLGLKPNVYGNKIVFHDKDLYEYLKVNCGVKAENKRIPREILELCSEDLKLFYETLMKGDGYIRSNSAQYSTISSQLANDFQELLLKIGLVGCIKRVKGYHKDYPDSCKDVYLIAIRRKRLEPEIRIREIQSHVCEIQNYTGWVWCPTVSTGVVFVRRNGKPVFSGNSDFWAFPWFPGEGRYSVLYSPMDHVDYGAFNVNLIKRYDRVISFLPFQQRELEKYGVESPVIPHGVDRVFKPMDKKEARRITRLPEEDFIVGIVAANSDKETRKSWGEIFRAAGYIRENFPEIKDLKYFVHSDPEDPKGVALKALAHKFGVLDIVAFEDPHLAVVGLPDSEMVLLYNSFDVLLNPARREGFGLPILEAMACGVPVIGHNFSSMPDLIGEKEERGWLAKTAAYIVTPINAITGIVDWKSVADCILDAYLHPDKVERKGKAAREFAKTMYWDDIIIDKWVPFLDEIAEDLDRRSDDIARIEF